jgi:hypothetical protein
MPFLPFTVKPNIEKLMIIKNSLREIPLDGNNFLLAEYFQDDFLAEKTITQNDYIYSILLCEKLADFKTDEKKKYQ